MSELGFAWCAGIIDGEGCIGVYHHVTRRRKSGERGLGTYSLILDVTNTDMRMLVELRRLLGGRIRPHKSQTETTSEAWSWRMEGSTVQETLRKVLPYLVNKREQAMVALELEFKMGVHLTADDRIFREDIRTRLVAMKKGGE